MFDADGAAKIDGVNQMRIFSYREIDLGECSGSRVEFVSPVLLGWAESRSVVTKVDR